MNGLSIRTLVPGNPTEAGPWRPIWQAWLRRHSSQPLVAPPGMGAPERGHAPLEAAPGNNVHEYRRRCAQRASARVGGLRLR